METEPNKREEPQGIRRGAPIDRLEALRLAVLALIGALGGFLAINLLVADGRGEPLSEPPAISASGPASEGRDDEATPPSGGADRVSRPDAVADGGVPAAAPEQGDTVIVPVVSPPRVVPAGPSPDGVRLAEDPPYYFRCWDKEGKVFRGEACDRLRVFEKRLDNRLYVLDRCRQKSSNPSARGRLSLGVEIDFAAASVKFWSGSSTEIDIGVELATCLRTEMAGIPLGGIPHRHDRYTVFFAVDFGDAAVSGKKGAADGRKNRIAPGQSTEVSWSRANLRFEPSTSSEVKTILERGTVVKVLKVKGDWVQVKIPDGAEGWIALDGLR